MILYPLWCKHGELVTWREKHTLSNLQFIGMKRKGSITRALMEPPNESYFLEMASFTEDCWTYQQYSFWIQVSLGSTLLAFDVCFSIIIFPPGNTPLYKLYRYVPRQRVWFLSRFGLKTGIDFDHFGLKSVWFSRKPRERINVFVLSTPNV